MLQKLIADDVNKKTNANKNLQLSEVSKECTWTFNQLLDCQISQHYGLNCSLID